MSWSTSELRVRLAPLNRFKLSSKIFYWPFQGGTSFVDLLCFFCLVFCYILCLCAHLFICALWSPAGKGLPSGLSFVVSNCVFVTIPLVSWVRCGTRLYWFLIFAPLLTLIIRVVLSVLPGGPKSLPPLSFSALIIPILRFVYTISFRYSCPWISSMSCTAFKITRWPISIPHCITSAFYIPVDLY